MSGAATRMPAITITRLGGDIELDERVSWCPPATRGSQPVSCYLIQSPTGDLLVDTGLRLHEEAVLADIDRLHDRSRPLSVLLTRTEMECCLNLPAIEERFGLHEVWYTGGITVPRSHAAVRRVSVEPGSSSWIEPHPGLRLELISPLVRLLPTLWVYEPESATLLTSDAFTHGQGPIDDGLAKFSWFRRAVTTPIAEHLRRIPAERPVRRIGPGYGDEFTGDAVADEFARLADAVQEVGLS